MPVEIHNIHPVYDTRSQILILGSFPSVKSRESRFFYGHPQNRFWKVLANVLNQNVPVSIEEKRQFLLENHIAAWDVIQSCDIEGSSDSSIKNVIPNDFTPILETASIRQIFCNGGTSFRLYKKYCSSADNFPAVKLPSTSPANAAFSLERLSDDWKQITDYLG